MPPHGSRKLIYQTGVDSLYVHGTAEQSNDQVAQWLGSITNHYRFVLETGDILLFNNTGCAHKFTNLTGNEMIHTYRFLNRFYCHPGIIKLAKSRKNRDHIAETLLKNNMNRNPLLA